MPAAMLDRPPRPASPAKLAKPAPLPPDCCEGMMLALDTYVGAVVKLTITPVNAANSVTIIRVNFSCPSAINRSIKLISDSVFS